MQGEDGGFAIYILDVATGQVRRLTYGLFPVWRDTHPLLVQR
jgi:hypothetical protein